jgi:hypothetical protein
MPHPSRRSRRILIRGTGTQSTCRRGRRRRPPAVTATASPGAGFGPPGPAARPAAPLGGVAVLDADRGVRNRRVCGPGIPRARQAPGPAPVRPVGRTRGRPTGKRVASQGLAATGRRPARPCPAPCGRHRTGGVGFAGGPPGRIRPKDAERKGSPPLRSGHNDAGGRRPRRWAVQDASAAPGGTLPRGSARLSIHQREWAWSGSNGRTTGLGVASRGFGWTFRIGVTW